MLFSVRRGKPHPDASKINVRELAVVYLNVLGVVVLAEPTDAFSLDRCPDPEEVHGVDSLPRLSDLKPVEDDAAGEVQKVGDEVF